ncbi:MAG: hypothetical protein AAF488_17200 [Planctomycetota bacterium]
MKNATLSLGSLALAVVAVLGLRAPASAGSHLWQVNEAFSNADGTVQFIELRECCGSPGETGLATKWVASAASGMQFNFPGNLSGSTANQHLLLATAAFAALPGAPTPDYIIPENFIGLEEDVLTYWMYGAATMTILPGDLPLDGVNSYFRDGTTGTNSPTNFAGATGSVVVGGPGGDPEFIRGDANQNGGIEIADAVTILDSLFSGGTLACERSADANDDNALDISDAIFALTFLFASGAAPQAPYPDCGIDPTAGALTCASSFCP